MFSRFLAIVFLFFASTVQSILSASSLSAESLYDKIYEIWNRPWWVEMLEDAERQINQMETFVNERHEELIGQLAEIIDIILIEKDAIKPVEHLLSLPYDNYSTHALNNAQLRHQSVLFFFSDPKTKASRTFEQQILENILLIPDTVRIIKIDYASQSELVAWFGISAANSYLLLDGNGEKLGVKYGVSDWFDGLLAYLDKPYTNSYTKPSSAPASSPAETIVATSTTSSNVLSPSQRSLINTYNLWVPNRSYPPSCLAYFEDFDAIGKKYNFPPELIVAYWYRENTCIMENHVNGDGSFQILDEYYAPWPIWRAELLEQTVTFIEMMQSKINYCNAWWVCRRKWYANISISYDSYTMIDLQVLATLYNGRPTWKTPETNSYGMDNFWPWYRRSAKDGIITATIKILRWRDNNDI